MPPVTQWQGKGGGTPLTSLRVAKEIMDGTRIRNGRGQRTLIKAEHEQHIIDAGTTAPLS